MLFQFINFTWTVSFFLVESCIVLHTVHWYHAIPMICDLCLVLIVWITCGLLSRLLILSELQVFSFELYVVLCPQCCHAIPVICDLCLGLIVTFEWLVILIPVYWCYRSYGCWIMCGSLVPMHWHHVILAICGLLLVLLEPGIILIPAHWCNLNHEYQLKHDWSSLISMLMQFYMHVMLAYLDMWFF